MPNESPIALDPRIEPTTSFPLLWNDMVATSQLSDAFTGYFGDLFNGNCERVKASEDFGLLGSTIDVPSCFWVFGSVAKDQWEDSKRRGKLTELHGNHTSRFAPVIDSTLKTAVEAYAVAALTWLCNDK